MPVAPTLAASNPVELPLPAKKKLGTGAIVGIVAGALVVLLGIGAGVTAAVSGVLTSQSLSEEIPDSTYDETFPVEEDPIVLDWAPAGFTQWDDNLAYRFVTDEHSGSCSDCTWWFIEVTAHYDCSNGIYAEMNIEDSAGTVVDWSNDTASALYSDQTALLEFDHYPYESDMSGTLTDLTCHP